MGFQFVGLDGTPIAVDSASNAARALLYAPDGSPLVLADRAGQGSRATPGIPAMGLHRNIARVLRTDSIGTLQTGRSQPHIVEGFEGTTINTQLWTATNTTFAQAQIAGQLTFNSGSSTASGGSSILVSNRRLPRYPRKPLAKRFRQRILWRANSVMEFGAGSPTGVVAETNDSAMLRITGTGEVVLVAKFGSNSESVSPSFGNAASLFNDNIVYDIDVWMLDDSLRAVVLADDGTAVLDVRYALPSSQQALASLSHLPAFVRLYTTAITASAPQIIMTGFLAETLDMDLGRDAPQLAAFMHRGLASPTAYTQLPNYANSAAPVSASLSNTAAGYATLGGQWQFVAVAGAETDYALFSFQVPATCTLCVQGFRTSTFNMGAAVATTPTLLQWGLGINGTGQSLASGAHMRTTYATQVLAIGTPIGGKADEDIVWTRRTPLITEGGRFFNVILKMPVGTATASQIVRGVFEVDYWFE